MEIWFFIFVNAPDTPSFVESVYPASRLQEARLRCNRMPGYLQLRQAMWNGYGPLPLVVDTAPVEEIRRSQHTKRRIVKAKRSEHRLGCEPIDADWGPNYRGV